MSCHDYSGDVLVVVWFVTLMCFMLNLAKSNPELLGFAIEGDVVASIIFWIICYAMSKYSYNLELKYKTER